MQFFSIYDLLTHKAAEKAISIETMISFLQKQGVRKSALDMLKQTSYYPDDDLLLSPILSFLGMTKLELDLSMGKIPALYRKSFFSNISTIANILQKDNISDSFDAFSPFFENQHGTLYNGDCIEIMKAIESNKIDLVFADPPFNLGKEYDSIVNDSVSITAYLNWTYKWIDECIRILKPGGYLFIYNIPKWCTYIASYLNQYLTYWDWISIDMKYRLPINNRLYPSHYGMLVYVKGVSPTTFNNQRIPLQTCRHCGGDIKDYGGYKGKMNPNGVNVSDVWSDIYPVRHKTTKNRKFNELPIKLLHRVIHMSTNEGDTVFDPFGGSGTTYAVAQLINRKWIGCEIGDCSIIANRLLHPQQDTEQLNKIKMNSNKLFAEEAVKLRKKNGFWLCEDFSKEDDKSDEVQLQLNIKDEE